MTLLRRALPRKMVLLSGDIHSSDLLIDSCVLDQYSLVEFTSSGITHSVSEMFPFRFFPSFSQHFFALFAQSSLTHHSYFGRNWGFVQIDWDPLTLLPTLRLESRDSFGNVVYSHQTSFADHRHHSCPSSLTLLHRSFPLLYVVALVSLCSFCFVAFLFALFRRK